MISDWKQHGGGEMIVTTNYQCRVAQRKRCERGMGICGLGMIDDHHPNIFTWDGSNDFAATCEQQLPKANAEMGRLS